MALTKTIRGYVLNKPGRNPNWSSIEYTLLQNVVSKLPDEDDTMTTTQHIHNKLVSLDKSIDSLVYCDDNGCVGIRNESMDAWEAGRTAVYIGRNMVVVGDIDAAAIVNGYVASCCYQNAAGTWICRSADGTNTSGVARYLQSCTNNATGSSAGHIFCLASQVADGAAITWVEFLQMISSGGTTHRTYFNYNKADIDCIFSGDSVTNLLYIDAGIDDIGIGAAPGGNARLEVTEAKSEVQLRLAYSAAIYADLGCFDDSTDGFCIHPTGAIDAIVNIPADHCLVLGSRSGTHASARGRLAVSQEAAAGALSVLYLSQSDVDEPFIKCVGTAAAADLARSIVDEDDVGTATLVGYLKIEIDDTGDQVVDGDYFIPFYSLAP